MRFVALGAAAALLTAACSGSGGTSGQGTASAPASHEPASLGINWKACAAFDVNGLGDKGFNDLAMKGLEDAKAKGYDIAWTEAKASTDFVANLQLLIDEGCQTIIIVGVDQTQAAVDATLANEDIAFAQVDATWDESGPDAKLGTADDVPTPANFTGLDFQADEAAMLAGYLAAGFSKSGKIGTYGGEQYPGVTRFMDGLSAGIARYKEQKGTDVKLFGWNPVAQEGAFVGGDNPWNDPAKGEQLARSLLDQGVDILHPVSGATGNGSIKAMMAAGKWAIGVDTDQALSLPQYSKAILTSVEKMIDAAVLDTIAKNAGGDLGGENYLGTLANKGVGLAPFHDLDAQVPAELKAEVEQLSADIAAGTVKVADYLK